MQFQHLDRNDAETVYAAILNISGSTLSAGAAAFYDAVTGDGISVSVGTAINKFTFAGIVKSALSNSSYGRAQVYGVCSAYMVLTSTAVSATPGTQLNAVTSQTYLKDYNAASSVLTEGNPWNFVTLMDTMASAASTNSVPALKTVFVRAL